MGDRPSPELGVFETVRVLNGAPLHLPAHLARLTASAARLFDGEPPPDLARRAHEAVRRLRGSLRLRLALSPDASGSLSAVCETGPAPEATPANGFELSPWTLPGGLGEHKWLDRRLVDALAATSPGVPLLVDGNGDVLEAAWGNVWAIEGGRLVTPPADGRLLPGVTRNRLLRLAPELGLEVVEDDVSLQRLGEADGAFLTSALREAVPAHVAGGRLPHPLVAVLADALLDRHQRNGARTRDGATAIAAS